MLNVKIEKHEEESNEIGGLSTTDRHKRQVRLPDGYVNKFSVWLRPGLATVFSISLTFVQTMYGKNMFLFSSSHIVIAPLLWTISLSPPYVCYK